MKPYARTLPAFLSALSIAGCMSLPSNAETRGAGIPQSFTPQPVRVFAHDDGAESDKAYLAAREAERVARLRSSAIGTRDFCSITRSSSDPAPRDDEKKVTCHFNFGSTSLAELDAAGWKVAAQAQSAYTTRWGFQVETVALTIVKVRSN
ncbi:hypothetical protein QTH97_11805 [Variovorax sp. J22R24]|uniref:hypothetical protein n=1 Tax=Variovorax gracilis TaxID=3053502 RepID=UPI0025764D9D|nr:hypothetical protein [Variovorax sp. J22R24]MDM0105622.1 hypothetical protein [Variovorax sp. J22R24]